MRFGKSINNLRSNPRLLLLIDGLGAFISAFSLVFILPKFEKLFGIPIPVLNLLACFPICFAFFDFYIYQKNVNNINISLRIIAILNLFYCLVSIGVALYHKQSITYFGWIYLVIEIIIISLLAILEYKIANFLTKTN